MAGTGQWWVIWTTPLGGTTSYTGTSTPNYFQGTQAQAQARAKLVINSSTTGPYPTKAAAQAAVAAKTSVPNPPVGGQPNVPGVGNPLSGLAAIGDFFSRLTQASTWIRVAEIIVGAGLIIVSLAKLAAGTPAGKAAIKAGKVAAIL